MGYAEHNLISGETITHRGRLHAVVLARSILLATMLDLFAIGLIVIAFTNPDISTVKFAVPAILLLIASGMVVGKGVLSRNCAEFVVTSKRVIIKTGIVHKHTAEMFLNKIETIGVDQTLTGRTLGFGSISIHGTGGSSETFEHISDPFEFRRQIQEQIGASTGNAAATTN
ncbi:MAG TPA: PH domain-containing protein [Terriglobales bacterium]|nr:PH domain-containing protein [Terriglobales bacterium]